MSRTSAAVSNVRPRRAALLNDTQFSFGLTLHLRKSYAKAWLSLSLSCIAVSPVPGSLVGMKWTGEEGYLEDTGWSWWSILQVPVGGKRPIDARRAGSVNTRPSPKGGEEEKPPLTLLIRYHTLSGRT